MSPRRLLLQPPHREPWLASLRGAGSRSSSTPSSVRRPPPPRPRSTTCSPLTLVRTVAVGLVIKGFTIPVPRLVSKPLLKLAVRCRILDPPALAQPASPRADHSSPPSPKPSNAPLADSPPRTPTAGAVAAEPVWNKRLKLVLDLRTAPVVGCIFLLATTVIDGSVVRLGIVGEDGVRPYDVLVLFISLVSSSSSSLNDLLNEEDLGSLSPRSRTGLHLDRARLDRRPARPRLLDFAKVGAAPAQLAAVGAQDGLGPAPLHHPLLLLVLLRRPRRQRPDRPQRDGLPRLLYPRDGHHGAEGLDDEPVRRRQRRERRPRVEQPDQRPHRRGKSLSPSVARSST